MRHALRRLGVSSAAAAHSHRLPLRSALPRRARRRCRRVQVLQLAVSWLVVTPVTLMVTLKPWGSLNAGILTILYLPLSLT
jgi:hypothetical protein